MLNTDDICLIIPTYNRAKDVNRTLYTLVKNNNVPGKIFIIDQSRDKKTKKIVKKYKKKLPVAYVYSETPSSSIAENIGVKRGKKSYELLLISGDDVDFMPGYMKELVKEFNKDIRVKGIGGVNVEQGTGNQNKKSNFAIFFLRVFFLPYMKDHKYKIIGPYGYTYSSFVNKPIRDAQWIPGFNNCFRREVYDKYEFPKIRGYNVLEDIDCSYSVYKKYGKGSLVITPKCRVLHRESKVARYPERKRIFVNHEDHFAFYYKHFNNKIGTIKMIWSLSGIIFGNIMRLIINSKKESNLLLKNNIQAIFFCYKNRENIKKEKFRLFLDKDMEIIKNLA